MELTVGELRSLIASLDDDLPVHVAYNYGDRSRTIVAPRAVDARVRAITRSDYHRMDRVVQDDEEGTTHHPTQNVLVLTTVEGD